MLCCLQSAIRPRLRRCYSELHDPLLSSLMTSDDFKLIYTVKCLYTYISRRPLFVMLTKTAIAGSFERALCRLHLTNFGIEMTNFPLARRREVTYAIVVVAALNPLGDFPFDLHAVV